MRTLHPPTDAASPHPAARKKLQKQERHAEWKAVEKEWRRTDVEWRRHEWEEALAAALSDFRLKL